MHYKVSHIKLSNGIIKYNDNMDNDDLKTDITVPPQRGKDVGQQQVGK